MEAYIDEEDNVTRFVAAELESAGISPAEKKKHRMERQYVHFLYTKYTEGEREDPVTKRVFYKQMSDTFDTCKSHGKRYFIGVRGKSIDFDDEPMDSDDGRAGSGGS